MKSSFFVPSLLREGKIWMLWRLETGKNGRLTKVPYSALTERKASSTDSNTWSTFTQACDTYNKTRKDYSGLGVAITEEMKLVFIDIDHCINAETGDINETATDILRWFPNDYVEVSQSGTGIHIFTLGTVQKNFKNSDCGVEMYGSKRYCAFTGRAIQPEEPTVNQEGIDYVTRTYMKPEASVQAQEVQIYTCSDSDDEIISKASKHGKFSALYCGEWDSYYSSQSEADIALCEMIAFWCDRDREIIDRIFRSSGLYRMKWDEKHFSEGMTYGEVTIQKAVQYLPESISEWRKRLNNEINECILSEW